MAGKKKILYILREASDAYPIGLIQTKTSSSDVSVILIQNATELEPEKLEGNIFVLLDDLSPSHPSPYPKIRYKEILKMIFAADSVVTW